MLKIKKVKINKVDITHASFNQYDVFLEERYNNCLMIRICPDFTANGVTKLAFVGFENPVGHTYGKDLKLHRSVVIKLLKLIPKQQLYESVLREDMTALLIRKCYGI